MFHHRLLPTTVISLLLLAGCAATAPVAPPEHAAQGIAMLERASWGVNAGSVRQLQKEGWPRYLQGQLHPGKASLPPAIQAQIDAMSISQVPLDQLVMAMEQKRRDAAAVPDDAAKQQAQKDYQQELNRLAREAATRSLLLDVYSTNQLLQQLSWFWLNHFSVHQGKHNLRAMVGDYEANAIAPHALGKFRDLLGATVHHPAMLRYLDNEANAVKRINENYARELMELHTLGVNGGYSQADVQELARILTGVGVNLGTEAPKVKPALQSQYVRRGLFEFNPNRHDYGDKQFLGQTVKGRGLAELDEALDRLSRSPATARFISGKLAQYFVGDNPPDALVARMAATFEHSDGMIADVLQTLFASPEFRLSLGKKFKDPMHYVVSAVRLSYDDKPILNAGPMLNWLSRMGQPLYGRQTPDGYPLADASWASPGQMTTRFDIARTIGSGSAGLFKTDGPQPQEKVAFPQLASALYYQSLQATLSPATRQALEQAASPQEWNTFLLSSPEMMHR
ncbi:DUF1800 domain-containing protein [Janthinobacterium sp. 1_2014MBL_MicDiv]|uniref:DUF1800 domain-containing protein n=1 Tax=Janthinobacterium sp. 1_2014MBL_MicDiv TaxID=1644131 RepID=UPI0008F539C0|nr:DUF1800 domain-containing protein [Janthinobacterium sp. 1_2014MBL_MicDiv]APA69443.1 hypothetical protein YQ44_18530 [Janthinobacterium sp. 1_2014MBL_MicDiv]